MYICTYIYNTYNTYMCSHIYIYIFHVKYAKHFQPHVWIKGFCLFLKPTKTSNPSTSWIRSIYLINNLKTLVVFYMPGASCVLRPQ